VESIDEQEHEGCESDSDGSTEGRAPDQVESDLRGELRTTTAQLSRAHGGEWNISKTTMPMTDVATTAVCQSRSRRDGLLTLLRERKKSGPGSGGADSVIAKGNSTRITAL
jgi:hypothetical protein